MGALASVSLAAGHVVYASMRDSEGRGAGRAVALRFATERAPGKLRVAELDVLSEASATRAVARIVEEQGRLDVVVNNAAHLFFAITEALFDGRVEISRWNANENIGTRNRIAAVGVTRSGEYGTVTVGIEVSGEGYNGPGTFVFTLDDRIERLVITA